MEVFIEQQPSQNEIPSPPSTEEASVKDTQTSVEPNPSETDSPSPSVEDKTNETIIDNNVVEQIPDNKPSPITTTEKDISNETPSDFFYDFKPEHFHAEQVRTHFGFLIC